jgi:hypothetical protein
LLLRHAILLQLLKAYHETPDSTRSQYEKAFKKLLANAEKHAGPQVQ